LERFLQEWAEGRRSRVWLSIDIVLDKCPELRLADFKTHNELCGSKPVEQSGFCAYFERHKLHSIYIIDLGMARSSDRKRKSTEEEVAPADIRAWKQFLGLYMAFPVDSKQFLEAMFKPRQSWLMRGEYTTLAASIFGIAESRLILTSVIRKLASARLLPTLVSVQPNDLPIEAPAPAPRTRLSAGEDELLYGLNGPDIDEDRRKIARDVIGECDEIWLISDSGDIYMIMIEEWLLTTAIYSQDLLSSFSNDAERAFESKIAHYLVRELNKLGPNFPAVLLSDSRKKPTGLSALPPPTLLLKQSHLRIMFMRFMSSVVGKSCYARDRERRLAVITKRKLAWFATQLFRPPDDKLLLQYFEDAARYQDGHWVITHKNSLLSTHRLRVAEELAQAESESRSSFESHKRALTAKNEFHQTLLSHRTIFLFNLAKEIGEISDAKWLLVLNLFIFAISGELLDVAQLKQICITGCALVTRSRQITWRLQQVATEKINSAPGISTVATDDTTINNCNAGSRAISYVNIKERRPVYECLSVAPTGRKTSEAGAAALVKALKDRGIKFDRQRGGSSDNAPNASNTIFEFFRLSQAEVHGVALADDGNVAVTIFNGVHVRTVWFGSGVHILHLLNDHFRRASFGNKTDMNDPSGGQLAFKWNAILRSDNQVSGRGTSTYQVQLNDFFGCKGPWSKKMTEEHEGRWGQSLEARKELLELIDFPMQRLTAAHARLGPNALAAAAMYLRKRVKKKSWQIPALLLVAIWSCSPEITWSIRVEVEASQFYHIQLAWLRAAPDRAYMKGYSPEFKARLIPGHIHDCHAPYYKLMATDPAALLPHSVSLLPRLFEEESHRETMLERVRQGGLAQLKCFTKHYSWVYEGLGIVLMINAPKEAGAAARAIVQVLEDLIFESENDVKIRAFAAIEAHRNEEKDRFWLHLAKAESVNVRHFALQFGLVGEAEGPVSQLEPLSREWLKLCELTAATSDLETIEFHFDRAFPILHERQLYFVDPHLTDTTMLEGLFSVQRRKFDKSKTNARFEDVMYWDREVITPLRSIGRAAGEEERAASKARRDSKVFGPENKSPDQSANDWCRTYEQCDSVMKFIDSYFLPIFDDEEMAKAPRVRSFKTTENTYTYQDEKLVKSWASKLETDAEMGGYRRDISSEELLERGREIKLTFKLVDTPDEPPLQSRLSHRYSTASATALENELKCHLPFSLIAMRAAATNTWPPRLYEEDNKRLLELKVLLAALLPPMIKGRALLPCFRDGGAILKGNALVALGIFIDNASKVLEYLGNYDADMFDVLRSDEPTSLKGAGAAGAFFIIGPFSVAAAQRLRHAQGGFSSIFLADSNSSAETAMRT